MMSNKRKKGSLQVVIGCVALCMAAPVFADRLPVAPYILAHGGLRLKTDWSANWEDKFSYEGTPVFAGIGGLFNPSIFDNWLFSVEGVGYFSITPRMPMGPEERGGFISFKVTFPETDGIENFFVIAPGFVWYKQPESRKKDQPKFSPGFACMIQAGRNWHISNGIYLTARFSHMFPSGEHRKQNFSGLLGVQIDCF